MSSARRARRVGVFGGTFDPPHVGHLLAASDAAERLLLDRALWIPAGQQPLKRNAPCASAADRLRMVELAVEGHPRFQSDASEVNRGGLSFTVDTLADLKERFPDAELFLLMGEDSWRGFAQWREPERIRKLARVAVLTRDSSDRQGGSDEGAGTDPPLRLETRRVDVSATEVRERVSAGLPIRGFVTESVERFIVEQGLYKQITTSDG